MREVSKLVINALLVRAVTFLTGCSNIRVSNHDIAINNQSNDGYVALSGLCSYFSEIAIFFKSEDSSSINESIPCRGVSSSTIQLLLKLPAVKYVFYKIISGVYILFYTKDFKPIELEVIKGKVVYLGQLQVSLLFHQVAGTEINLKVSDESESDIPWFLQNFKNIPHSA